MIDFETQLGRCYSDHQPHLVELECINWQPYKCSCGHPACEIIDLAYDPIHDTTNPRPR